jgi:hypothetical protein
VEGRTTHCDTLGVLLTRVAEPLLLPFDSLSDLPSTRPSLLCTVTPGVGEVSAILLNVSRDSRLTDRLYDETGLKKSGFNLCRSAAKRFRVGCCGADKMKARRRGGTAACASYAH